MDPIDMSGQLWIFVFKRSDRMMFASAVSVACAAIVALRSGVLTIVTTAGVFELES